VYAKSLLIFRYSILAGELDIMQWYLNPRII
jgi:hypothetical protein